MIISSLFSYHLQCRCLQEGCPKLVFGALLERYRCAWSFIFAFERANTCGFQFVYDVECIAECIDIPKIFTSSVSFYLNMYFIRVVRLLIERQGKVIRVEDTSLDGL